MIYDYKPVLSDNQILKTMADAFLPAIDDARDGLDTRADRERSALLRDLAHVWSEISEKVRAAENGAV